MSMRVTLVAVLLAASLTPALADNVTATVSEWDATGRTIVLEDKSQFMSIPDEVAIPQGLKAGDRITIDFYSDEDGVADIFSIQRVR